MKILMNKFSCINSTYLEHDDNGDNMNRNDLWLLFAKTGKIEYYLKYKNYSEDKDFNEEDAQEN